MTMQQRPKGKGVEVGLVPRTTSLGVSGELRVLIRSLREAAMDLCR